MPSLLTLQDYSKDWIEEILYTADIMKSSKDHKKQPWQNCLVNKNILLYFEKPSLRTHLTFEIAVKNLGGNPIYYNNSQSLGRESDKDMIKNISRWGIEGIVARVYKQETLETFAKEGNMPVINALSDMYHPCQALADYMTIKEITKKDWKDIKVAYIGEPNNVSNSLMICGSKLGVTFTVVTPVESDLDNYTKNIDDVKDYDVIYTDTWLSMGDTTPIEEKIALYKDYQVNQELLDKSNISYVLHCLPAHRGQEITDEVIDSHEEIYQQAENRLWTEIAILFKLFE